MKRWTLLSVLLLAPCFVGCRTISITDEHDSSVDFSEFSSFDWSPDLPDRIELLALENHDLDRVIRGAVESCLAAHGYERRSANVDVFVSYHVDVNIRFEGEPTENPGETPRWNERRESDHGRGDSEPPGPSTLSRDIGSLIIEFLDPTTMQVIWRGVAESEVHLSAGPERRRRRVELAVHRILERYPPP